MEVVYDKNYTNETDLKYSYIDSTQMVKWWCDQMIVKTRETGARKQTSVMRGSRHVTGQALSFTSYSVDAFFNSILCYSRLFGSNTWYMISKYKFKIIIYFNIIVWKFNRFLLYWYDTIINTNNL